jgi:hypothetical protein
MSVTINAKGTSVSSFIVGRDGTLITQTGGIFSPTTTDLTLTAGVSQNIVLDGLRWPNADGTTGQVLTTNGSGVLSWTTPSGSGTVTSTSVVTANGFAGTVATATTTPAITLTTTITGVLKGNGTAISAAAATDFAPAYEEFVATASQTVFNTTLSTIAMGSGKAYLQVFVNGVFQQEGATKQFTVTGANQITFNTGVSLNSDVVIFSHA